ncbi:hypothetical protein Pelo_5206 [Pelomyxa schiedti]|nr:hypothetical protein Pelo_5206 [Pelomyxa schiedti]
MLSDEVGGSMSCNPGVSAQKQCSSSPSSPSVLSKKSPSLAPIHSTTSVTNLLPPLPGLSGSCAATTASQSILNASPTPTPVGPNKLPPLNFSLLTVCNGRGSRERPPHARAQRSQSPPRHHYYHSPKAPQTAPSDSRSINHYSADDVATPSADPYICATLCPSVVHHQHHHSPSPTPQHSLQVPPLMPVHRNPTFNSDLAPISPPVKPVPPPSPPSPRSLKPTLLSLPDETCDSVHQHNLIPRTRRVSEDSPLGTNAVHLIESLTRCLNQYPSHIPTPRPTSKPILGVLREIMSQKQLVQEELIQKGLTKSVICALKTHLEDAEVVSACLELLALVFGKVGMNALRTSNGSDFTVTVFNNVVTALGMHFGNVPVMIQAVKVLEFLQAPRAEMQQCVQSLGALEQIKTGCLRQARDYQALCEGLDVVLTRCTSPTSL